MKKIGIVLGLYDIRTIISKFVEIFCYNPKRYFHQYIDKVPKFTSDQRAGLAGDFPGQEEPGRGGKCIYYLVHCFYPYHQGGTERFIYNMALQAKKEGNRVKVVTYNAIKQRGLFKNQFSGILYNEYQMDGLEVLEYRHKRAPRGILKDIVLDDKGVRDFARFLFDRERPDIVHAGYIQKVSSFLGACRDYNIPYMITLTSFYAFCHYDIMIDQKGNLCTGSEKGAKCRRVCPCLDVKDSALRYQKAHALLKDAAFVTGPSLFVKNLIESEFAGVKIDVINHGVSRAFMGIGGGREFKRKDVKSFAYIGSITPIKGIHLLLEAFLSLPPEYTLNIYGTGYEGYLRRLMRSAQGKPHILFHGAVKFDQMVKVYEENDVIVIPSIWYETYNFVLHEALLMNKIVIVSHIGAMPERIKNGRNGFSFVPGDSLDLKRAMEEALTRRLSGDVQQESNINTIEEEFGIYNRLYESAISEEP